MTFLNEEWYLATPMSGRTGKALVHEALDTMCKLSKLGIKSVSPVIAEKILPTDELVSAATDFEMRAKWKEDKAMIRRAPGIIRLNADRQSFGCERECGFTRYYLWRPVIYVFPEDKMPRSPIPYFEDDFLASSIEEAGAFIFEYFGTWEKRREWRRKLYTNHRLKALGDELKGWL